MTKRINVSKKERVEQELAMMCDVLPAMSEVAWNELCKQAAIIGVDAAVKFFLRRAYLERYFNYHPPKTDHVPRFEQLREAAKVFAEVIYECTPECADQTAAIRLVREAVMTANAAIACHE